MEGGAWQSDFHDNGRDVQKTRTPQTQAAAMEAWTPPAMYNPSPVPMAKDSRLFGVLVVSLRSALILFTLIAFSLMAANKESYNAFTGIYSASYYKAILKFSAVKAFVGLLSLDIIVCFYAIVQLVLCFVQVERTGTFVSSLTAGGSVLSFIFDTVLAYALIATAGAAADAQSILGKYCGIVPGFCRKAQASIAISFFAFAILAVLAALYPVRLLRLSK